MGEVSVTLNGRSYRLECGDGEEQHLLSLADTMGEQIESLKGKFGQIGDDRLMLMAGLMIADNLAETRTKLAEANAALDDLRKGQASADKLVKSVQEEMAVRIGDAAERIEALNALLSEDTAGNGRDGAS
jgi:cell division protein ZapA